MGDANGHSFRMNPQQNDTLFAFGCSLAPVQDRVLHKLGLIHTCKSGKGDYREEKFA
jgi:hypothetical protein